MSISFAKYDKNGNPWKESKLQEVSKTRESVRTGGNPRGNFNGERSFIEVVMGETQNQRRDDWEMNLAFIKEMVMMVEI